MDLSSYERGLLFSQAHTAVRQRIYDVLENYELTPSTWAVLGIANRSPEGVRLANVARQMNVKAPLITMLTNDMIEKNLIKRVPHHFDGRAKLLIPTLKGKQLASVIEDLLNKEIESLMQGVSEQDSEAFQKALQTILDNASKV
jgi:DNA-binding MarR family transcriptional regulator